MCQDCLEQFLVDDADNAEKNLRCITCDDRLPITMVIHALKNMKKDQNKQKFLEKFIEYCSKAYRAFKKCPKNDCDVLVISSHIYWDHDGREFITCH